MRLHVDQTGTPGAPAVVFLHGIGTSGWMWWKQTPAFADFHCLNVDLPGHGKSNHVPWVSLEQAADEIAAVIDSYAANGRAHIVGLSLGGHIALILLEHHARLLERVVISGVTAAPWANRALLKPQLWLLTSVMRSRWFADMQARAYNLPPDAQAALRENLRAMSPATYRRIAEQVADYGVPPALGSVNTPTLVTAGSRESTNITGAVRAIAGLMPNGQGRIAPGVGHGWNVEAPELFNETVRAWLSGAPLPPALQDVAGSG